MTTTAAPEMQARVLDVLLAAPVTIQAQYASHLDAAKQGELSGLYAMQILRQVCGLSTEDTATVGELPRQPGKGSDGSSNHKPVVLATEAQVRFVTRLIATKTDGQDRADYTAEVDKGISKSRASTIIDMLINKPDLAVDDSNRATDKQVAMINRLMAEHGHDAVPAQNAQEMTRKQASDAIELLLRLPKPAKPAAPAAAELDLGIYEVDGQVYRVKRSRTTGHHYAQRLVIGERDADGHVPAEWVRDREIYRTLTAAHKMSLERAMEYGKLTGVCCRCGSELENDESIAAGIGPVCRNKDW